MHILAPRLGSLHISAPRPCSLLHMPALRKTLCPGLLPRTSAPGPRSLPRTSAPRPGSLPLASAPRPNSLSLTSAPRPGSLPRTSAPRPGSLPLTSAPRPDLFLSTKAPRPGSLPRTSAPRPGPLPRTSTLSPGTLPRILALRPAPRLSPAFLGSSPRLAPVYLSCPDSIPCTSTQFPSYLCRSSHRDDPLRPPPPPDCPTLAIYSSPPPWKAARLTLEEDPHGIPPYAIIPHTCPSLDALRGVHREAHQSRPRGFIRLSRRWHSCRRRQPGEVRLP